MFKPTRDQLTAHGRPLTQSLFLENQYTKFSLYTLKDYDHEYKGRTYLSIKRLYLEMEDTTEYEFANQYFLGWNHWQRICNNALLTPEIEAWRRELELKLRAIGVRTMIDKAKAGNLQASKWLADKGFDKRHAGRPTKGQVDAEVAYRASIAGEFADDLARLRVVN